MTKGETQKKKEEASVSKEEFDNFKKEMHETQSEILSALKGMQQPIPASTNPLQVKPIATVEKEDPDVLPAQMMLPTKLQLIFEKYFDPQDGFVAELEGTHFKMIVPNKLSNAGDAYWVQPNFIDIRAKQLDGNDIPGSMERYLKLVVQNLRYNKDIKLKS